MTINKSLLYPLISNEATMVQVCFLDNHREQCSQPYTYKTIIAGLKQGDYVVVQTRGTLSVAQVSDVNLPIPDIHDEIGYRWIVSVVDTQQEDEIMREEAALIRKVNEKQAENARAQALAALGITDTAGLLDDVNDVIDAHD